jgi:hypothetical protein
MTLVSTTTTTTTTTTTSTTDDDDHHDPTTCITAAADPASSLFQTIKTTTTTTTTTTTDQPLLEADAARLVAQQTLRQSGPDLERQVQVTARQIHETKQLLGRQQMKLHDLKGMSACAETLCFRPRMMMMMIWNHHQKDNKKSNTSKVDAVAAAQQELLAKEAHLRELCAHKKQWDREIQSLQQTAVTTEDQYQTLLLQREECLLQSYPDTVQTILRGLRERDIQLGRDIDRTQRIIAVAVPALASLHDAADHLGSAANWGVVDLLGGGMMV